MVIKSNPVGFRADDDIFRFFLLSISKEASDDFFTHNTYIITRFYIIEKYDKISLRYELKTFMAYSSFYAKFIDSSENLKSSCSSLWRYYPSRIYLAIGVLLQVLVFWQAFWMKTNLSGDLIVLRYKIDFGANLLAAPQTVLYYPLISLAVLILNLILAILFASRSDKKIFIHLFLASATAFAFFMSLYLLSVFLINFR